ncbi:MAG: type II secretion system protein [Puniceicoccales bacterium]
MKTHIHRNGLSLLELMVTLGLMLAFLGFVTPNFFAAREHGRESAAIARAQTINLAIQTYRMKVATAGADWNAAANDSARFLLIRDYLGGFSGTLADFAPQDFAMDLPDSLPGQVTLYRGGEMVNYDL